VMPRASIHMEAGVEEPSVWGAEWKLQNNDHAAPRHYLLLIRGYCCAHPQGPDPSPAAANGIMSLGGSSGSRRHQAVEQRDADLEHLRHKYARAKDAAAKASAKVGGRVTRSCRPGACGRLCGPVRLQRTDLPAEGVG
jgi:hypothetical protein